ncbi:MAG: hypothetical protein PHG39_07375 [Acidithiobacillus ferrooxidans]|nr:hypothetical protein [Acidithiobacillus ferrooxidans]MDD5002723.1 hypothetical protein [Acidithiobacillus sp.]MDD5379006.1 hypothetical protein [Acidithiobacillus sp.]MDD5575749.1 hypothetical protein [Acidithiobacillus sp.]
MCVDINGWLNNIVAFSGPIGAAAWLAPWVYKRFSRPSLKGRLVSHFENAGNFNGKNCLMHFLAINVISLNRCFNIKDTQISVRYKSTAINYKGELFWARKNEWTDTNRERIKLKVQPEDTLLFVGTIPQDVTKKIYLTFRVDKAELEEFDEITLIFNEQSGCSSTVSIKSESIDGSQILWDDRIWEIVSPN